MENSILEAIRQGNWDYEPLATKENDYHSTAALPGTDAKLKILADRIQGGLPLWHPNDRITYDDNDSMD